MKVHELAPKIPRKKPTRKGQGDGSKGSFSGRGCKGQKARAGGKVRLGFEGGQSGALMRMPKLRGFKNPNRVAAFAVNLAAIETAFEAGETVTPETLITKKVAPKNVKRIKVLASGELSKKLTFENVEMSATAKTAIEKAGGTVKE